MIPDHRYRVTAGYLGALACVLVLGGCTPAPQITGALQPHDHDAIIALEQKYVAGWMAGDPDRVIATFTPDAVLLPHHGFAPRIGTAAARELWWPPDTPPSPVTAFTTAGEEIGGNGKLAYTWGRFTLASESEGTVYANEGNYMRLFRKDADGARAWKINHQIWNDPVPTTP